MTADQEQPRCFNCDTTENVKHASFDLDLPTIASCPMCLFALSGGDEDLLKELRPRRKARTP